MIPLPSEVVQEWSPRNGDLTPDQVSRGSIRAVWWRCAAGHEWQASPNARCHMSHGTLHIRRCPVCTGQSVQPGVNDLGTTHPALLDEWDGAEDAAALKPTQVSAGSTRRVRWKCRTCSFRWSTEINARALAGTGCPACRGTIPQPGITTLDTVPAVAALWHPTKNAPLVPQDIHKGSNQSAWWLCEQGHTWCASPQEIVKAYHATPPGTVFGCKRCTRRNQYTNPHRLFSEEHPDLVAQWHPTLNGDLTPADITGGSDRYVWWRCRDHGHAWQASIKTRARGSGCPYCAHRRVLRGFNDLATIYPRTAAQWHPTLNGDLTPADITASSSKKVYWLCENGHTSYGSPCAKNTRKKDGPIACAQCFHDRRHSRNRALNFVAAHKPVSSSAPLPC